MSGEVPLDFRLLDPLTCQISAHCLILLEAQATYTLNWRYLFLMFQGVFGMEIVDAVKTSTVRILTT